MTGHRSLTLCLVAVPECATNVANLHVASTAEDACRGALCVDDMAEASMSEARDELARCVPSERSPFGDPSGLRISGVAISSVTGDRLTLRVVLANTLPGQVMSYPGTQITRQAGGTSARSVS